ncbi:MAG: hypothetical protein J7M32_06225 [Deltaproteobacteria bacterium]|nr:hypothetical protein [Deltaproteobacteria bacterium]
MGKRRFLGATDVLTTTLPPRDDEFFFLLDDLDGIPEGKCVDSVEVQVE